MANRPVSFGTQQAPTPSNIGASGPAKHSDLSEDRLLELSKRVQDAISPLKTILKSKSRNKAIVKRIKLIDKNIADYLNNYRSASGKGFLEASIAFLKPLVNEESFSLNAEQVKVVEKIVSDLSPIARELKHHSYSAAPLTIIY